MVVALDARGVQGFFQYARRRHEVYLRRQAGARPPWTADPILASYRFTNIYRETDRTTVWFREHVRDRYDGTPEVVLATVLFRWFNKIETGKAMFCEEDPDSETGMVPFEQWTEYGDVGALRRGILRHRGAGPYVNGAYIIKTPNGMSKLDGVLDVSEKFRTRPSLLAPDTMPAWRAAASMMLTQHWTLEEAWEWVRSFECQGDFTAYEVVTDLRHTHLLRDAPDIMTWANAGPGAKRGLNRLQGRPLEQQLPKAVTCAEMRRLLTLSTSSAYWPSEWGQWEMREVEHTLCEWDKYERTRLGQGTPKQNYQAMG